MQQYTYDKFITFIYLKVYMFNFEIDLEQTFKTRFCTKVLLFFVYLYKWF